MTKQISTANLYFYEDMSKDFYEWFTEFAERDTVITTENLNKEDQAELQVVYDNCIKYAHTLKTYQNELIRLLEKDVL